MTTDRQTASSIETFTLYLSSRGYTPATMRGYVKVLSVWLRWCDEKGVVAAHASRDDIAHWLAEKQERAASTRRNLIFGLRAFYGCVIDRGLRPDDPTASLRGPKVRLRPIEPYDRDGLLRLLSAGTNARDRAMLMLLLGAGLRATELLGIRPEDINWGDDTIRIRGKGNKVRLVAPGQAAMTSLRAYLDRRPANIWQEGIASPEGLRSWFHRLAQRSGVTKANLHRFRHTFASAFLEAGGQEGQLQKILGHSTLVMSLHYGETVRGKVALEAQRRLDVAGSLVDRLEMPS